MNLFSKETFGIILVVILIASIPITAKLFLSEKPDINEKILSSDNVNTEKQIDDATSVNLEILEKNIPEDEPVIEKEKKNETLQDEDAPYGKDENGWAFCGKGDKQPGEWDDLQNYGDGSIKGGCIVPLSGGSSESDDKNNLSINQEASSGTIESPGSLELLESSENKISLSWEVVANAEGYNISRDGEYIDTVNSGLKYTDIDIKAGKIYSYQVSAYADNNYSQNSDKLRVKATAGSIDTSKAPELPTLEGKVASNYDLKFFDEFNGQSLDLNKWNTAFLWGPETTINEEEQYYVDVHDTDQDKNINPFSFEEGKLIISAKKIPRGLQKSYNNKQYTSGIITSYDAFKFTHGYAEAKVKIPQGQGLWPAFWLLNAYYREGQKKPEIDIMENLGQDTNKVYQTYHFFDPSGKLISTESHVEEQKYSDDFHIYSASWEPGKIQFYIDGKKTNLIEGEDVANEEMYVLANLAVGGSWPGAPDESTLFPAEYQIDWIRVYQKK